ncbi:MAG: cell division protein SepF [Oscillospiraceae bacterium]|nr:cell division protein SepF [Oscillospiraceae bacterium]
MNLWEKMTKFARPYSDDEYEDDYEEETGDYAEEEQEAPRSRRTSPFDSDAQPAEESTFRSTNTGNTGFSGRVVNSGSGKYEMFLYHAKSFGDVPVIAKELRDKKGVIVNMEGVDESVSRRVVDFLSGCAFIMDGSVKKVAKSTYFFYAHNTSVSGDLENVPNESESYF